MNSTINYLGIARKAGKLATGEEAVRTASKTGRAKLVLLANDASPNAARRAQSFTDGKKSILLTVPLTRMELAHATGSAMCAMAAVTDAGLAAAIAKALATDSDNEEFREASEKLSARSAKALRRRKEQKKEDRI